MAIEVTDEMRQAVLAEMCAQDGHAINSNEAVGFDRENKHGVRSREDGKLPHLVCARCGVTWLVLDEAGASYEDAEEKLRGRVKDPAFIDEMREKRKPKKPAG